MNTAINLLLELLAAAPAVAKSFQEDSQAWHQSHGWTEKTVAAAATAAELANVLKGIAEAAPQQGA